MAYPQTAQSISMPAPVKGLNKRDPLAAMDPLYSPSMLNWEPAGQYLRVRPGWLQHCEIPSGYKAVRIAKHGDSLFAYCQKTGSASLVYNITTATPTLAYTTTGTSAHCRDGIEFGGNLAFISSTAGGSCIFDGSTWAALGFTTSAPANINAKAGCTYKGRVYLGISPTTVYYSALAAVTGVCTTWDISTLFKRTGEIKILATLSPPSNRLDDQLLVVGHGQGEILVFAGDNPGATNWQLVGAFDLPVLRGYHPYGLFNGDIWLNTVNGIYSVRALFEKMATDLRGTSPSFLINSDISALQDVVTTAGYGLNTSIVHWPEKNYVYVAQRGYAASGALASATATSAWIYNTETQAWGYLRNTQHAGGDAWFYFDNNIYWPDLGSGWVYKMGTVFADHDTAGEQVYIPHELKSAHFDLGSPAVQVVGVEPTINCGTLTSSNGLGVRLHFDFGRRTTSRTIRDLATGYQVPLYSIGEVGRWVQYDLGYRIFTSTIGCELYSVGMITK